MKKSIKKREKVDPDEPKIPEIPKKKEDLPSKEPNEPEIFPEEIPIFPPEETEEEAPPEIDVTLEDIS